MKKFSAVVAFVLVILMTGCTGDGGGTTKTLLVKVENDDRSRIPNATVVLGDSNGVMIESKTTDTNGEATFSNPPANATVTAAATMSCLSPGITYTDKDLFIRYDVNVSTVTAGLDLCNGGSAVAGTAIINVNITNIPAEATRYHVQWGGHYQWGTSISGAGTEQIMVGTHDLQSDGKVSIVVVADDSSYNAIGYGVLTDITPVSGMTVTIAANQVFSNTIQYQFNNIPATAKNITRFIWESRKQQAGEWGGVGLMFDNLITTGTSTTISVPYIPGFGDKFEFSAGLEFDQNNNGSIDSSVNIYRVGTLLENQTFDMSQVPSIPTNLTITGNNTATPTFSWSGSDSSALEVDISANTAGYEYYYFNASPARTSVTFPQLPDTLAVFRPTAFTSFSVNTFSSDLFTSYADYELKMEQYENGTWIIPAAYTIFTSEGRYSSTQTLAPALSKTAAPSMKAKRTKRFGMSH